MIKKDNEAEPKIADIPSFQKVLGEIRSARAVKGVLPLLRPFLRLTERDLGELDTAFDKIDELEQQAQELTTIPDRFNDFFAQQGWIIYEEFNLEVAKAAVAKAESGDMEGAELELLSYYSPENVRWHLKLMQSVEAFRPRTTLAAKALTDYEEERYHACVPVVLALLDGFVNELQEKRRGFFAEEVDLQAWDSIAAHNKGLNTLSQILKKSRKKTVTDEIRLPYRHGILHGMDLGYDNQVVAAKTWAALFATRDWAIKAEKGLLEAQPEKPAPSIRESMQKRKALEEDKKKLAEWKPRTLVVGRDLPETGNPEAFVIGSPEQKLTEFLTLWKAKNYGHMAQCLHTGFGSPPRNNPREVRRIFGDAELTAFTFVEVLEKAAAATEIITDLVFMKYGDEQLKTVKYRLVYFDKEGNAAMRGENGQWKIMNWDWEYY